MTSPPDPDLAAAFADGVRAIAAGELDALRALLDAHPALASARGAAQGGPTLLHYTGFNGYDEVCHPAPASTPQLARLLLERGAQADALLEGGATHGTSMCWALSSWFTFCAGVQDALVDAYLEGGAALDGVQGDQAPLGHAIQFGYTSAVEHLAARGARTDHLLAAAALGDTERVRGWWRDGAFAPEALAFPRGHKLVTGRFSWPLPADPDPGALALVTAATHGRAALVRWLLEVGLSPDACVNPGQTALHFAAHLGQAEVVEALLDAGARTDLVESQFDKTAAQWARENGEEQLAERVGG